MIYKYSQLSKDNQLSYYQSLEICKDKNIHLGQLKLFFSELLFLSMMSPNETYTVVYVGAASGYHINKLVELFPNNKYELWDPREFEVNEKPNIKMYRDFFTDISAKSYADSGENILFICDMRNMNIGNEAQKKNIGKMDQIVDQDMVLQKNWCQIIRPKMAYLKFRLPYEIPSTKYLSGTIFLQPYTKISTEARLMTNDYFTQISYDNFLFEKMLAYHNAYNRCQSKIYHKWDSITRQYNLINNWDNAYGLYITRYYLKKIKNNNSMQDTGKLFMDILHFHIKKYGKKYDPLFSHTKNI